MNTNSSYKIFFKFSLFVSLILLTNAKITINYPHTLALQFPDSISAKYSNFGSYKFGFAINGRLFYDPTNIETDYACKPINSTSLDSLNLKQDGLDLALDSVPVLMVDRGHCSFVTKVRNVQNAGGKVALIVNNVNDDSGIFALNDDGTGSDITIPGILISQKDGEILRNYYIQNIHNNQQEHVRLNIDNTFNDLSDKIDLKLDFIASDKKIYQLINRLMNNREIIEGGNINIIPNYVTKSAYNWNENINNNPIKNCLCNGKYCASHELDQGFMNVKVTNEDVLIESIRQKCIYTVTQQKKHEMTYWTYMREFYNSCITGRDFTLSCSRNVLNKFDSSLNKLVEECFINSFVYDTSINPNNSMDQYLTCKTNTILDNDSQGLSTFLKNSMPVIFINSHTFYGSYTYENVFEVMCANLKNKPSSCFTSYNGLFKNNEEGGKLSYIMFAILFVIFNIFAFIYLRRYLKKKVSGGVSSKEINDKINDIVSAYMALKDKK